MTLAQVGQQPNIFYQERFVAGEEEHVEKYEVCDSENCRVLQMLGGCCHSIYTFTLSIFPRRLALRNR